MPATLFVITGGAAQDAGDANTITITADDVSYVGDHAITFSGANDPPFTGGPSTLDKDALPVAFGQPCTLTFVAGVATTDMTLTKAESVNIACTDGTISAAGANRLAVTVTAGAAIFFDWSQDAGASVVAGVEFQIIAIFAMDGYGNIDTTYDFPAGKNITFGNVSQAPDGTLPTMTDIAGVVRNFAVATPLAFNLGVAVADGTQLKCKLFLVGTAQTIRFGDGVIDSATNETSPFLSPKAVNVTFAALDHFAFVLGANQLNATPFVGTNTITAQDAFDNTVTSFDASGDNVVVAEVAPLVGTVSGLGSGADDTLDQAGDFVLGVANLTGVIVFTGTGVAGTFTATSVSAKVGTSGSVSFNAASQGNPILYEAPSLISYQNSGAAPNSLAIIPRVIQWDNPSAAGHEVEITDLNGQILFHATAKAQYAGKYVVFSEPRRGSGMKWQDFIVTQLDSGQLFIWY